MPDDPVDQLRIWQARLARRKREVLICRENRIRVRPGPRCFLGDHVGNVFFVNKLHPIPESLAFRST